MGGGCKNVTSGDSMGYPAENLTFSEKFSPSYILPGVPGKLTIHSFGF
jgi:hypothetical protein